MPAIPKFDPEMDTVEDQLARLSLITNRNFNIVKRLLYGQLDTVNIRSGGILLADLLGGELPQTPEALGAGLNLTSEFMGYYNGTEWATYIKSDGSFYFGGEAENYIAWDGSELVLQGSLSGVTGTFSIIGAGSFPTGAKVLMGDFEGDPLIEMYDSDETLRLQITKDQISFFTEEKVDGETTIDSEFSGSVKGVYWEDPGFNNIPEVRLEVPYYCNIIATHPTREYNYARIACVNTDDYLEVILSTINLPVGGNPDLDNMATIIRLGQDVDILASYGEVLCHQALLLDSEYYNDHLKLTRFDDTDDSTCNLTVSPLNEGDTIAYVASGDATSHTFYVGGTAVAQFSVGTKSAIVPTSQGDKLMYAVESPDVRFCDVVEITLTEGEHTVVIPPLFKETIGQYVVMPFVHNGSRIELLKKEDKSFTVSMEKESPVTFFIYGKRVGTEGTYMESFKGKGVSSVGEANSRSKSGDKLFKRTDKELAHTVGGSTSKAAHLRADITAEGGIADGVSRCSKRD